MSRWTRDSSGKRGAWPGRAEASVEEALRVRANERDKNEGKGGLEWNEGVKEGRNNERNGGDGENGLKKNGEGVLDS